MQIHPGRHGIIRNWPRLLIPADRKHEHKAYHAALGAAASETARARRAGDRTCLAGAAGRPASQRERAAPRARASRGFSSRGAPRGSPAQTPQSLRRNLLAQKRVVFRERASVQSSGARGLCSLRVCGLRLRNPEARARAGRPQPARAGPRAARPFIAGAAPRAPRPAGGRGARRGGRASSAAGRREPRPSQDSESGQRAPAPRDSLRGSGWWRERGGLGGRRAGGPQPPDPRAPGAAGSRAGPARETCTRERKDGRCLKLDPF